MKFVTLTVMVLLSLGTLPSCSSAMHATNNWTGTYEGILPCGDCPGIQTTLSLRNNQTFSLTSVYLDDSGTKYPTEGKFIWKPGNIIELSNGQLLEVSSGEVNLLDADGQRITGELTDAYRLTKLP